MTMRLAGKKDQDQSVRTVAWLRGQAQLCAAIGIAAAGLAALAATVPAQAATSAPAASHEVWQQVYSTHGGVSREFDAITAPTEDDAWAVEDTSTPNKAVTNLFFHWNGKTWSSVAVKAAAGLNFGWGIRNAFSTSAGNVWFFGQNETTQAEEALVYNGKGWHIQPVPSDFAIPLAILGPADVWGETAKSVAGETGKSTVLAHWNGRTWSDVTIGGIAPVASSAGGHTWIMTIDASPVHASMVTPAGPAILFRVNGADVSQVAGPRHVTIVDDESGIAAAPDGRLWILGCNPAHTTCRVYSWSGSKWAMSSAIPADNMVTIVSTFSYDGKNGFWDGPYAHWTGSKMINTDVDSRQLGALFWSAEDAAPIPGTDSVWSAGFVFRAGLGSATNAVIAVYGPLP